MNKIIFNAFMLGITFLFVYYTGFYHEYNHPSTWEAFKFTLPFFEYWALNLGLTVVVVICLILAYKYLPIDDYTLMKYVLIVFGYVVLLLVWLVGPNNTAGKTTIEQANRGVFIRS